MSGDTPFCNRRVVEPDRILTPVRVYSGARLSGWAQGTECGLALVLTTVWILATIS